jgi:hypothetical protein
MQRKAPVRRKAWEKESLGESPRGLEREEGRLEERAARGGGG